MKPLRSRLQQARTRLGIPWDVLERDYLLSWILAGIACKESLRTSLAFKGGTALKKCYFGDYRFSEDLDFSAMNEAPTGAALEQTMQDVCQTAAGLLDEYVPVTIMCERYVEKEPHPGGQEAFSIRAQFPWHRKPQTRVIVEVCVDEQVLLPVQSRPVIHEYGESLAAEIPVYSLEEIVAEKLRAILQHAEKLQERGWSRSRARDFYDLWRILSRYEEQMNLSGFADFLARKCAIRKVDFNNSDTFFEPTMMAYVEKTWQQWLGPLVPELPEFALVVEALRPRVDHLLTAR